MRSITLLCVAVLFVAVCISVANAQWNNNNGQQQFPNFPQQPNFNIDCSRPGANCQSTSQVCDSKGNCKTQSSGSAKVVGNSNFIAVMICGIVMTAAVRQFA